MRTRDRPAFLERALASVLDQTFADFELVIVNDGGEPSRVDSLVSRAADPRIHVLHHPSSQGMVASANHALENSSSTFVAVHDDDDTWAPSFLERTTAQLEASGGMGVVVSADKVIERLVNGSFETVEQSRLFPDLHVITLYDTCSENYATPIALLYRRVALETVGPYDPRFGGAADWEFALRFLTHFDIDYLRSDDALAFYHHRPDADGIDTNSVYTEEHRRLEKLVANELLRADLKRGTLGLGLIVNSVRFDREAADGMFTREKQAIDERIDYLAACIHKVEQRVDAVQEALAPSARIRAYGALLRRLVIRR